MLAWRRHLAFVAAAVAATLSGCNEKSRSAPVADAAVASLPSVDAGDSGALSGPLDAGSLDDTAMPAMNGEELDRRMGHLLEAMAQGNPDLASDALFPRDAYVASRDATDPQRIWDTKVASEFRRSVERNHKRVKGIARAKFVSFTLGRTIAQLAPKRHEFKKPLWRVKHSRLTFTVDGKTRQLDIAEMTAWRGAWYVTKLR